jgi:hypothetical protein
MDFLAQQWAFAELELLTKHLITLALETALVFCALATLQWTKKNLQA